MDVLQDIKPGTQFGFGNNTINLTYDGPKVRIISSKPVGNGSLDNLDDQVDQNGCHDVDFLYLSKWEKEGNCARYT